LKLSVVVTVVDSGQSLERCLAALDRQKGAPEIEVIVPYDDSVPDVPLTVARHIAARALPLGAVHTERPIASPAGQHELFDRRRSAGLRTATGELVAILEDRGAPRADWALTAVRLHQRLPHAVIGGAIEHVPTTPLAWAVYLCDFGRYQLPFASRLADWVSDVNVTYKRRALEQTAELWRERYHENRVHAALLSAGETLFLSNELIVDHRREVPSSAAMLSERFHWGRLFGSTRARDSSPMQRATYVALGGALPIVLLGRLAAHARRSGVPLSNFARAAPRITGLLSAWVAGELVGYLTRKS
jgi:hypothetical protein